MIYFGRNVGARLAPSGETGTGIFNGELGIISEINEESKSIEIVFDDEKNVWYEYSDLDQIEHSYSVTIHKSQRQ